MAFPVRGPTKLDAVILPAFTSPTKRVPPLTSKSPTVALSIYASLLIVNTPLRVNGPGIVSPLRRTALIASGVMSTDLFESEPSYKTAFVPSRSMLNE